MVLQMATSHRGRSEKGRVPDLYSDTDAGSNLASQFAQICDEQSLGTCTRELFRVDADL